MTRAGCHRILWLLSNGGGGGVFFFLFCIRRGGGVDRGGALETHNDIRNTHFYYRVLYL